MDEKTALLTLLEESIRLIIKEWNRSPTEYLNETDVHVLLATTLRQTIQTRHYRSTYLHRLFVDLAWQEPVLLSLVGCTPPLERKYGRKKPDVVLWDPTSQGTNNMDRHALAVIELKAGIESRGYYSESVWDKNGRREDYLKVCDLVRQGFADWGLALVFCALPSSEEIQKFDPLRTPAFERHPELQAARFRIINNGQVPDFQLI